MNIRFTGNSIEIEALDDFLASFLRILPAAADPSDSEDAARRIYPGLTANDPAANAEWSEFVGPELRALFCSHTAIVTADLRALPAKGDDLTLSIPLDHGPAWIHTLNQARLAIHARHGFTEAEIETGNPGADPARAFALLQMEIYAIFLSAFLEGTGF